MTGRLALLALALLFVAPVARADDAAMARFHHEQAGQHYRAGRFDRAVQEFFLAQRLSPNSRTVYNIGLCFLRMRRPADAFFFLSEYLALDDDGDGAEARRGFAESSLRTLAPSVARVAVRVEPPREGAVIYVDQREYGSYGTAPRVLALAPGPHRVWVELEGHRRATAEVVAVLGEEVALVLAPELIVGTIALEGPPGAAVRAFDARGVEVGAGRLPLDLATPPGRVEVEVVADGYRPWRGFVVVTADERTTLVVDPERAPGPTGDVTVTANVAEAVIELDGEPVGLAPLVLTDLRVASRRVRVSAPGAQPWAGELEIEADTRGWLTVQLAPLPTGPSPLTWVIGGLGLAALITGGVTAGLALERADQFRARWSAPGGGAVAGLRDEASALALASDVAFGIGLVALGAAIAIYFATDDANIAASSATFTRRPR
ncbi:MAG: PEGA domain-containing protein [Sandaracinaceae bacterium]|nr:PEGA domain-containing protein [Sandaracinaceae bacterium]